MEAHGGTRSALLSRGDSLFEVSSAISLKALNMRSTIGPQQVEPVRLS
jgi:hypothetical protein